MIDQLLTPNATATITLGLKIALAYIAIMWIALAFSTFRDINRRSNDPVTQLASVALPLLFFIPGYWLYLVIRPRTTLIEAMEERTRAALVADYASAVTCPSCHQRTRDEFVVCPNCEHQLRNSCSRCSHALLDDWKVCPYCGQKTIGTQVPVETQLERAPLRGQKSPVHA